MAKGAKAGWSKSTKDTYPRIAIDGKLYRVHRLAWLYVHGVWPEKQLDHKDGVRNNAALDNLRPATQSENNQNQKRAHKRNKSGYLGVCFDKKTSKWRSAITLNYKTTHLGYFDTPAEAHEKYLEAKSKLHPFGCL